MVSKIAAERSAHALTKDRGLYDIADAENEQWESRRQQLNSLSALSLFTQQEDTSQEHTNIPREIFDAERPTTPINDSIKSAPKTYASLSKLIYRRINPRPELDHITEEDQSSLGAVIMGEVNAIWPVLRRQVADPFLTHQQNKELQRRITVHCVTVCEQLFVHYADKIKLLNSRGIFSNPANLSRIRAQLALDAGKYLNILSVRRHIISDLKKPSTKEIITFNRDQVSAPSPVTPMTTDSPRQDLSFRNLVKSSRPRRKMKYQFNLKAEINSMQSQMPTISRSKIQQLQPLANRQSITSLDEDEEEERVEDEEEESETFEEMREERRAVDDDHISVTSQPIDHEQRCPSEPIPQHTLLIEELRQRELEEDEILMKSPSTMLASRQRIHSVTPVMPPESREKCKTSLGLERVPKADVRAFDPHDPKEDLRLLIERQERERKKEKEDEQKRSMEPLSDIPPLIQALTRREAQDEKVRKLKIKEKELDLKFKEELEEKMKPLPQPQYPQPAVVQTKLPGISNPVDRTAITIRASDVKINDHVDLSTVTLGSYQPVYNDLKGDISQATVKELDANLFQGGELREVYSEIMKTVPNIHQHYDNDPLIVTPGTNVDLSQILASSTLVRPRSQQVINPKLRRYEYDMPWQGQQMMWMKSSTHPQSGYQASDASSMSHAHGEGVMPFHRFTPSQLNHPGVEKGSRAYASWLQWWKNTINTDDFFKYLSTQDTDFLSVLFHFYDSEAADSETESMRTAKMEAQRERDKKLTALKKEKEEFVAGLWNVKAVTLGGLGKDPEIEEEEFSDFGTPKLTDRSQSISQLGSRSLGDSGTPRSTRTRSESVHDKGTTASSKNRTDSSMADGSRLETSPELTIQERLEIVWQKLKMPDSQKLDFALKYSSDKYIKKLPDIVRSWERVTELILQREKQMNNLEIFEKEASDPNRFFEKGHRGSSVMRLEEAKTRASYHKKLENVEVVIKSCLISLKSRFDDDVTYSGRPYMEKMGWDKIEMLYYLQQERRCTMLKDHGHPEQLDLFLHVNQQSSPSILPPSGRRYTKLPLKSATLAGPQ